MTIYFTSDWHISHANIIKYCERPFENIEDMNYHILGKYLRLVQPQDTVFILGDLTIKRSSSFKPTLAEIIKNLPGQKHLVRGNHDYYTKKFYLEECGFLSFNSKIETEKYIIVHDPADYTSEDLSSQKILIHGHQHHYEWMRRRDKKFDVGVDGNNFYPVNLEEIKKIYNDLELLKIRY